MMNDIESAIPSLKEYLLHIQARFCQAIEKFESTHRFKRDQWHRPEGGGGLSCILEGGEIFERAGINFSHVQGQALPSSASAARPELAGAAFQALGVSLVFHPRNPYVPTTHFNVRFFSAKTLQEQLIWWFGGGFDLTPYYGFDEDCIHWHQMAKSACDPFGVDIYPHLKAWCDEYFYLTHRQEPRGIGGIFFDDWNADGFDTSYTFMQSVCEHFLLAYLPIVEKRYQSAYGEKQREFQRYRRGRYVEFNLIYDRGTLFGLQSNGRTESILVSMPPEVSWRYDWQPVAGSEEAKLYNDYLIAKDWLRAREDSNL